LERLGLERQRLGTWEQTNNILPVLANNIKEYSGFEQPKWSSNQQKWVILVITNIAGMIGRVGEHRDLT
jgi:hypothetical protein